MKRAIALLTTFVLVGCTNTGTTETSRPAPALRLVSYNSCADLLPKVRSAAAQSVGPWGFMTGHYALEFGSRAEAPAAANGKAAPGQDRGQDFSGTNTHTAGVDEPDMVKTDGKRIVVLSGGNSLHIIDAGTRREIGRLPIDPGAISMLLHGDRLLVLRKSGIVYPADKTTSDKRSPYPYRMQTHLILIDLSGTPKVVSNYTIEAGLVDARQTDGTARVVVRNLPEMVFPQGSGTDADRLAKNRDVIGKAPIEKWLPAYTADGMAGRVGCPDVSVPATFSGASLVTVLSFELGAKVLGDGDPTAVFADGDTVYGSGPNLYLANDTRWRAWRTPQQWDEGGFKDSTEIYQFDVTAAKPVYTASGTVPGWLLNQYSLSEYDGVLRVATTNSPPWQATQKSSSSVYTLQRQSGKLAQIGSVGGLGKGERIYAVRFAGPVGYVVTFRQTDPLYTIDLREPRRPKVMGELKIPGYSAYLHPVGTDRLIGVGQDATDQGRVTGTQISLFDVGNLADPRRIDQYKIARGYSQAEYDPHAFLYWPKTKLLVVPVNDYALLLRVGDTELTEIGRISHPRSPVQRSLVIGETLWTISGDAIKASTLDGSQRLAEFVL